MTELQIRYFFKVSEHLSFTQAAQELYVSQPSVSGQITELEAELGFKLFERKNMAVGRTGISSLKFPLTKSGSPRLQRRKYQYMEGF